MKAGPKQEQGFTLIEVLASIIILSIVSLVLTSYFINAMSYSKSNQNKTIMVNLARNALFYVEKQDFVKMQKFFVEDQNIKIKASDCLVGNCVKEPYLKAFSDTNSLALVLHPFVNNIRYEVDIVYQSALLQSEASQSTVGSQIDKLSINDYLLPVKVEVRRADNSEQPTNIIEVEGYITDERIR